MKTTLDIVLFISVFIIDMSTFGQVEEVKNNGDEIANIHGLTAIPQARWRRVSPKSIYIYVYRIALFPQEIFELTILINAFS
ncbi:hypothetical protein M426DRAFT_212328 [Hypoxylon sp. CI-4A]|nr:hypothetical protein M426DRAFT_212328 [Hypoxylon sp. CI-4A]